MRMTRINRALTAIVLTFAFGASARAEDAAGPIRLNQLGVETTGPKRAILADPSTSPMAWTLRDARGASVASGQTRAVTLPAVLTVDLRLNEPRYASLPNIMKAKAKPLALKTPADFGVDVSPRLTVLKTVEPAGRKAGVKVGSVAELIAKLKDEAGVI